MLHYCKTFLYILFFTYSLTASSQTITFLNTYGNLSGYSVQQTSDSGYIVVGRTSNAAPTDIYLVKTDIYGDTLWTKTFGGVYSDAGYSIRQTNDNGYIIAGKLGEPDTVMEGLADVFIIKTDEAGDTLWTSAWGGGTGDYGYSVQQIPDGGYIVAGVLNTSINGANPLAFLTRLSPTGFTMWSKTYVSLSVAYSVQQTIDTGYIFTGAINFTGIIEPTYTPEIYLVKTNSFGDIIWSKTINGGLPYGTGYSVIQTSDSNFIITGQTQSFVDTDLFICKVDLNGNVIWSKSYGGSSYDWGRSVYQCFDGGYIVIGTTFSFGAGSNDIWLLRTDENGDTLWTKTFGSTSIDEGYCVKQCTDGGFILTGLIQLEPLNPTNTFFLIKTDSLGNIDTTISNINTTPQKKNKIHIYPNPSNESLFIDIKLQNPQKVKLTIFDIQGREIFIVTIKKYSSQYQLDISNYNKGIYIIQIKIGKEIINKKIIIE